MNAEETTEYAISLVTGDKKLFTEEGTFFGQKHTLDYRIRGAARLGNKIYKRKIIVIEDWVEYELPD